jgi:hypothetical protein
MPEEHSCFRFYLHGARFLLSDLLRYYVYIYIYVVYKSILFLFLSTYNRVQIGNNGLASRIIFNSLVLSHGRTHATNRRR